MTDQIETAESPASNGEGRSMRTFFIVWIGQLVSVTGTGVTGFALLFWVYIETDSVTSLSMITLVMALPATILSPIAGALVDRWDRRTTMLLSDMAAGAATLIIAVLWFTGSLSLWHVYLLVAVGSVANTFQNPAWMAALPLVVPRKHLGRANGLVQTNEAVSLVLAPAIAGALLATLGLGAVLIVDVVTFVFGVATLMAVRFPNPPPAERSESGSVLDDVRLGWRYLKDRSGLLYLLFVYAAVNFVLAFTNILFIPLVVSFANEGAAGGVFSAAGIGMLIGSVAVGALGTPKRLMRTATLGIALAGLFVIITGWQASLPVIITGAFGLMLVVPVVNAASQVLWQTKVAPGVQGRVFALRRTLSSIAAPLAMILAGPLADGVFEPLMADDGSLAGSIGSIIGTGDGRGIGLMMVISGIATALIGITSWLHPRIRHLEDELADQIEADPDEVPHASKTAAAE